MTTRDSARRAIAARRMAEAHRDAGARRVETILLIVASAIVAFGFSLVYMARTSTSGELNAMLASSQAIDINSVSEATKLLPFLPEIPAGPDRLFAAQRIYSAAVKSPFPNVGALSHIRVSRDEIAGKDGMERLVNRLNATTRDTVALFSETEIRNLKPFLVVRTPREFRNQFLLWTFLFFLSFLGLHLFWRYRQFSGDNTVLPVIELLCGIGMMMMVSLRDPVRDTLMFADFGTGILFGAAAMALFATVDYERHAGRSYIFVASAALLGLALASPLGTGPGTSDAKVNLFFFQPVEVMRILIVFFLAGYFGKHWAMMRELHYREGWLARLRVPRLDYVLPAVAGVAVALLLFALVKDNGPALVIGALFLILYAIARKRVIALGVGFAVIVLGFYVGHLFHFPHTVADRIDMWWSPWRNTVAGGDQLAHAMWSLATGGAPGTGLGLGSPATIPAGHTDLILSAAGEELGFTGLLCIFALYAVLAWRGFRAAMRAGSGYLFFLATGLTLIVLLQLILIAGGQLGLIPLSGVVSPFLSFGKTSMVANFVIFGIILSISSRARSGSFSQQFGLPMRVLLSFLGLCGVAIAARTGYIQISRADDIVIQDAEVRLRDHSLGLEYNPRLREFLRDVPKGDIVDRNGLPLATSNWETVQSHRGDYTRLGVSIDSTTSKSESRHYPLGTELFYLVGDLRSSLRAGARNTSFQERSSRIRLQGFDDYRQIAALQDGNKVYHVNEYNYADLVPVLRHRHEPDNPAVRAFMEGERNVRMSIDAKLQMRASAILKNHLAKAGLHGSVVVLDPDTGDLLASVSYPWPEAWQFDQFRANPDRLMEEEFQDQARFGLFPPGSSFKIVTAVAALRQDPNADQQIFECKPLPDGRVGNFVGHSSRPIRDDIEDKHPHGRINMETGIIVSCNAYFAQLGAKVGSQALFDTAQRFGIRVARPNTVQRLQTFLPQASYGQGEVVVSPFQMARVAATIANGGRIPQGRWVIDESNTRALDPVPVLDPDLIAKIAKAMREVVTSPSGTGKILRQSPIPIAGKTGTAELGDQPSHAWFIGFAPGEGSRSGKRIAFAVLVEHGQYGGTAAAPIAGEIVEAAKEAGLI
jgi:cell division protein FtsI/penicillin-binding protein 2